MLRLLVHPQKELQLDLKTNNAQNPKKTQLYGSPTTKDLKKPHSSRWVGGEEMWRWVERHREAGRGGGGGMGSPPHMWWIKIRGYLGNEGSQPHARPPSPGS